MSGTTDPLNVSANKHSLVKWIASGWVVFFSVLFATWNLLPWDMTVQVQTPAARLTFALSHLFLASLLLFVGFLAVGGTRWQLETADPTANPAISGEHAAKTSLNNRIHTQFLSNTTEQFVMFSAAVLAATPFLAPQYLRIITVMTILWILGRLFFWGGYWYTAAHGLPTYPRAIGLGMGLLCTLVLAAIAAVGVSLFFPSFPLAMNSVSPEQTQTAFSFASLYIHPDVAVQGSNLLPVGFISLIVIITATLAVRPRLAPPIVPMAILSASGWIWVLASGNLLVRW